MRKPFYCLMLALVISMVCIGAVQAAGLADSESASHSEESARYQVQAIYEGTDLRIVQFNLGVLSHYSYLLISGGKVLAVDPGRDIHTLLDYAAAEKLEWTGTFLTHSHADFVAGHIEMALATGKPVYASHISGAEYPHIELKEGSVIEVGKALVKIIETPGHTPDGLCGLVMPAAAPDKHEYLFSGDTLFVGSLGRPDLMGGSYSAAELAAMMFDSWNNKLALLKDSVAVLPAHGAGSLCGANLSDQPSSTIGQERKNNYFIKYAGNRSAFIARFLTGLAPAPQYFAENARINRVGPETVNWATPLGSKVENLAELIKNPEVYIVDVRNDTAYAASHVHGSVNIALRGRLETWTGIVVPFKARTVLVGSLSELEEAARRLKRVGYNAEYVIFEEYVAAGGVTVATSMITPAELRQKMLMGNAPVVLDVRLPEEWLGSRIGEVVNIPLNVLEKLAASRLDRNEPVVAVCNSSFRSNLAVGLLERSGFKAATSMQGGFEAWLDAGFPVETIEDSSGLKVPSAATSAGSSSAFRNLGLPERISAAQLLQMSKDLPGTFEVVDIRPADQIEDYNPTGARPVDLGDLLESPAWLAGEVPLVIVDRDGSLSMIAAGILSRKTRRPIKALLGGVEGFWRATEAKFIRDRVIMPSTGQMPVSPSENPLAAPAAPDVPVAPAAPSPKPVRKGAGC